MVTYASIPFCISMTCTLDSVNIINARVKPE